jgi:hypothetical protein
MTAGDTIRIHFFVASATEGWHIQVTDRFDYGQAAQFASTPQCGRPFGPGSTYCDTPLTPAP